MGLAVQRVAVQAREAQGRDGARWIPSQDLSSAAKRPPAVAWCIVEVDCGCPPPFSSAVGCRPLQTRPRTPPLMAVALALMDSHAATSLRVGRRREASKPGFAGRTTVAGSVQSQGSEETEPVPGLSSTMPPTPCRARPTWPLAAKVKAPPSSTGQPSASS
ncbi:hypothetical protein PHYSODRAFT_304121 [Phytophthora sojae]|uniref:Uncharacterized protein n=1 Tax=Phytophthora sojae (strain P6497) TaxID=1094619 RepID=G4ZX33_PHYSP|nr:hypothetical protein PHYSODRAFT_304121 [Phytophthora sojae]EGZ12503.1 hypothetical protein PHYSODRAFT_304121 [Phytophthora sojae]|eukprot:XP_009532836.1 hypothetical protein PHYSODRAFT_304121 [Phytophthora sojae]